MTCVVCAEDMAFPPARVRGTTVGVEAKLSRSHKVTLGGPGVLMK